MKQQLLQQCSGVRSLSLSVLGRVCVCVCGGEGGADPTKYPCSWAWGSRGAMEGMLLHVGVTRPERKTVLLLSCFLCSA